MTAAPERMSGRESRRLHETAMDYAELAIMTRLRGGDPAIVHAAHAQAYHLERQCADAYPEEYQPGYDIMHRSAATLAVHCGREKEARDLVTRGLAHTHSRRMRDEFQEVLDRIETGWWGNEARPDLTCGQTTQYSPFHIVTHRGTALCGRVKTALDRCTPQFWDSMCGHCRKSLNRLDCAHKPVP